MAVVMRHAALPAEASGTMLAVFEPGTTGDQVFASITRADARPIRETAFGFIWVVAGERARSRRPAGAGRRHRRLSRTFR